MPASPWLRRCFAFLILWGTSALGWASSKFNMSPGVTPISRDIYQLHMTVFWICVGIVLVVFSVLIYALIRHRKSRNVAPAQFHEHTLVEIIWAVIPFIILVIMAIPATKVLIRMHDTSVDADMTIKITGYQWRWGYDYLDEGISFISNLATSPEEIAGKVKKDPLYLLDVDNPLVVPINKKIRFLVTSNDVIHSWWVRELGIKRDAVPGFIYEAWATIEEPGVYRGQCAELCGLYHGYMPIVVVAKTEEEYQQWLAEQKAAQEKLTAAATKEWTKEELMEIGAKVYAANCVACHRPDGNGMPPIFPALNQSPLVNGGPISEQINVILNGRPGTAMQSFAQLSDLDLAAVTTYTRNAWDNKSGDIIQPVDIQKARAQ